MTSLFAQNTKTRRPRNFIKKARENLLLVLQGIIGSSFNLVSAISEFGLSCKLRLANVYRSLILSLCCSDALDATNFPFPTICIHIIIRSKYYLCLQFKLGCGSRVHFSPECCKFVGAVYNMVRLRVRKIRYLFWTLAGFKLQVQKEL